MSQDPKNLQINSKDIFYVPKTNFLFFAFFKKNFITFTMILTVFFFFFFRKILISVSSLFSCFFFFFFQKELDIFHVLLFKAFLCVFDNIYIPFLYIEEKILKNIFISILYALELILKVRVLCVIWALQALRFFHESLKVTWIVFINFSKNFLEYIRMENLSHKVAWNYSKNQLNCFRFFKTFSWIYKNEKSK